MCTETDCKRSYEDIATIVPEKPEMGERVPLDTGGVRAMFVL